MPRTAPDAHHLVQRLITLEELACAKGHVYPLLLVRLALTWACEAHTSYRGIALIFASLRGVVAAVGPCAETIRLWLLRVGLFLLRRPLPRCLDWVFLVGAIAPVPRISTKSGPFSPGEWLESLPGSARGY